MGLGKADLAAWEAAIAGVLDVGAAPRPVNSQSAATRHRWAAIQNGLTTTSTTMIATTIPGTSLSMRKVRISSGRAPRESFLA